MRRMNQRTLIVGSVVVVLLLGVLISSALAQSRPGRFAASQGDAQLEKPPVPTNDNEKKTVSNKVIDRMLYKGIKRLFN